MPGAYMQLNFTTATPESIVLQKSERAPLSLYPFADGKSASCFGGLMGSITPSGKRLFIRSATHLRCIGDPAVKYDGTRKACPPTSPRR